MRTLVFLATLTSLLMGSVDAHKPFFSDGNVSIETAYPIDDIATSIVLYHEVTGTQQLSASRSIPTLTLV